MEPPLKFQVPDSPGRNFILTGLASQKRHSMVQTDTNIERTPRDAAVILLRLMSAVAKPTTLSDPNTRPPELMVRIDTSPAI